MTITIKLSFKFGNITSILSAKTFQWVNHLCIWLLFIRTLKTYTYHIWIWLLLVQNCQILSHEHYKRNRQNAKKKCEKSTYWRIRSQTHFRHSHHWVNLIRLMTANTENLKAREVIKRKITGNAKQDSSDSSSSDSDSSDESDDEWKRQNKEKIYWKRDTIKLCAKLTSKLLTTAYKLKIIKSRLDEDPLQHRIYFPTFMKSPKTIFY